MPAARSLSRRVVVLLLVALTAACATYGDKVAPVPLPDTSPQTVTVDGAKVVAQAYLDPARAKEALGFDARGAGLIPVRFVVDNQSAGVVRLRPEQTFLLDAEGNAWPLLTAEQAYKRVRAHVGAGETITGAGESTLLGGAVGAVAGLAIGVLTGGDVAETVGKGAVVGGAAGAIGGGAGRYQELDREIRTDLEQKGLRLQRVPAGELAYGYLFFPGKDEAKSARSLRLSMEVAGTVRVVLLPL